MNDHEIALLQWAGPTLITIFGAIACFGIKSAFKALSDILRRNEQEHQTIFETLRSHEIQMAEAETRAGNRANTLERMREREERREEELREHGERITRVETRVDSVEMELRGVMKQG